MSTDDNTKTSTNPIDNLLLTELMQERQRQIDKGFDFDWDDQNKGFEEWCNDIEAYIVWARQMARMRSLTKYRRRLKQVAVLAIAACESYDRVCEGPEEDGA